MLEQRPASNAHSTWKTAERVVRAASRLRGRRGRRGRCREDEFGVAVFIDADDAAAAMERGGDIDVAGGIERQALGTAQAAVEDGGVAGGVDGVDDVVGGSRGAATSSVPSSRKARW